MPVLTCLSNPSDEMFAISSRDHHSPLDRSCDRREDRSSWGEPFGSIKDIPGVAVEAADTVVLKFLKRDPENRKAFIASEEKIEIQEPADLRVERLDITCARGMNSDITALKCPCRKCRVVPCSGPGNGWKRQSLIKAYHVDSPG